MSHDRSSRMAEARMAEARMAEALRLTREGRLAEATALLQGSAPTADRRPGRAEPPHPSPPCPSGLLERLRGVLPHGLRDRPRRDAHPRAAATTAAPGGQVLQLSHTEPAGTRR